MSAEAWLPVNMINEFLVQNNPPNADLIEQVKYHLAAPMMDAPHHLTVCRAFCDIFGNSDVI